MINTEEIEIVQYLRRELSSLTALFSAGSDLLPFLFERLSKTQTIVRRIDSDHLRANISDQAISISALKRFIANREVAEIAHLSLPPAALKSWCAEQWAVGHLCPRIKLPPIPN